MWFSRSGSRKGKEQLVDSELPLASKPLLEPPSNVTRSRDSSPTKAVASTANSTPARPDFTRNFTTPTSTPYDFVFTEAPTRISVSSSGAQNARNSGLLQAPQIARSQRNPSTVNLAEEDPEGTDRLFDPFTGRPIAVLNDAKQEPALQSIPQGDTLQGDSPVDVGSKHRSSGDLEDPVRQTMWDYLARIRSLQAEVAAMHLTMDGHALGDPWGTRPGVRSRSGSVNYNKEGLKTAFSDGSSTKIPTAVSEGVLPKTRVAGDSDSDEEARGKKKKEKRAEEFGELDRMFEKKQEALKSVMVKLKELSSVVRTYHELENPVITARQDTKELKSNVFIDSSAPVDFPTYTQSPQKTLKPLDSTNKSIPRLTLAPILTSSPGSSLPPSPLPPRDTRTSTRTPVSGRRVSLEMGAGGGRHGYIPILSPNAGPPPLPSPNT